MATLRLKGVTKRFQEVAAVNDVTLEAREGEFVCLLGPSGCGKTTTLRLIAGLEKPDRGEIYIGERIVNDLEPKDRDIAMVFQFYAMYPGMKVFDQIATPLHILKLSRGEVERRVKDAAELLGISDLLAQPTGRLTIEQRQKVEIARAIARQPTVYLFDEPLTNLDSQVRAVARVEIRELQRRLKTTTVYVTHDQMEAMAMADRIAVMNGGKILQYDVPDALYGRSVDLFVAGFIGSPPMNLIDCTLTTRAEQWHLDAGDFKLDVTGMAETLRKAPKSDGLVLGLRPEYLKLSKDKVLSDYSIEGRVDLVEPLGHRVIVDVKAGRHLFKCNLTETGLAAGDRVWMTFDKDTLRVFDRKTGRLII